MKYSPESLMMGHGYDHHKNQNSIKNPIYQTSTFVFNTAEEGKAFFEIAYGIRSKREDEQMGMIYSRINNPNLETVEKRLTLWDKADDAAVFESGMAAITTVFLEFLKPGSVLLYGAPSYGGTHHFVYHVLPLFGVKIIEFDAFQNKQQIMEKIDESGLREKIDLVFIETPANPTNALFDIKMCVDIAAELSVDKKVNLAIDNTFLGPLWQKPLEIGADIAMYSATKYLGGHSDLIAGVVMGSNDVMGRIRVLRTFLGNMASPNTAWLLSRSLETLQIRMERQAENAAKVARYLKKHPMVKKVHYLDFLDQENPSQFNIYKKQCLGPGAMISFDIDGGEKECFKFLNSLKLIQLAVSLGSTESLAEHPATMTHIDVPLEDQIKLGISSSLIRLSIGVENADDLIDDIKNAFNKVGVLVA